MSSVKNTSSSGDFFAPLIEGVTELFQVLIVKGSQKLPNLLKGAGNLNMGLKINYMKFDPSMLDCERQTLDPAHLGWAINYERPYPLEYFDPSKNTFIVGASGWGKSNLINILQENCLQKNQALIFIDPKGSAEAIRNFKKLCRHYRKKYYIFSEFDQEATSFNPIADMTNSQRLSMIMRSFDWGKNPNQYYLNVAQGALEEVLAGLSVKDNEFDLHDVYKKLKSEHNKEETSGLLTQFQLLLNSDFGKLFKKSSEGGRPSMTLKRAWEEKACIYIGCSTQGYSTLAKTVGKFFVSEAMNLSYWIGKSFEDSHKAQEHSIGLFIDEAGSVLFPDFLDLVNKCRSSGINIYTAVQSYSDMEMIGDGEVLMKQFFESYSNWFIQRQTNPENAEKLASACGTYLAEKTTLATEAGSESGRGTIRTGHEYLCHPDILKSINIGQTVLLEHGKKSLSIINIRDARKSSAFKEATEIERLAPIAPIQKGPNGKRKLKGGL
ncbi:MAG: type IV secretory system conjugative DNA transfer family protein [Bacteriovorax sp.]